MTKTIERDKPNRIQVIQAKHTWMLEREARALLVAAYKLYTEYDGITDPDVLDQRMDAVAEFIAADTRKNVEEQLKKLPPEMLVDE